MASKLKPCPFCGKSAEVESFDCYGYLCYGVSCHDAEDDCIGSMCDLKVYSSSENVVTAWNRRAEKTANESEASDGNH